MSISDIYIKKHTDSELYIEKKQKNGYCSYYNSCRWYDNIIDNSLIYSHRTNYYTKKTFTEGLHVHDYFELIIYASGNVEYITDNTLATPSPFSVIWFNPGQMHTATLLSPSTYERFVFYFTKDFFKFNNITAPMTDFMTRNNASMFIPDAELTQKIQNILKNIDAHINSDNPCGGLMAKTSITELFGIFNTEDIKMQKSTESGDIMMQIKNYIDDEYAVISGCDDISQKFHYSREHISRCFKERFNISISEYISKRRIHQSLPLIGTKTGSEVAYSVGFKSQSSYISAFVKNIGCLPSEYKKRIASKYKV